MKKQSLEIKYSKKKKVVEKEQKSLPEEEEERRPNSSPVCFAQSDEIQDAYKLDIDQSSDSSIDPEQ